MRSLVLLPIGSALAVFAIACSDPEAECGMDTDLACPTGEACIFEDGRGVCAESCSVSDPCSSGTCETCLASGDCPTCHVCVAACR